MERIKPNPGIWPIKPERLPERNNWIQKYEQEAQAFSACHFFMQLGSNRTSEKANAVRKLHDDLCRTERTELKMA